MHVIWYTAMSMDGRIADAADSLDFLDLISDRPEAKGEFPLFVAAIDAVLIGATTLRWLLRGGHGWPHDDLPTWLLSHDASLLTEVGETRAPLRRIEGDVAVALDEIEVAGHQRVWLCGGGSVAGQVLALDRLDEVEVTVAPTILGTGAALVDASSLPLHRFKLAECRPAGGDAARLRWLRDR